MRIGITDPMGADDRYQSYARWISAHSPSAELVCLSHRFGNGSAAGTCDGIILSGGGDVEPELYGRSGSHPKLSGVDRERDLFERELVDAVMRRPRPLLGICRGMQFVNVYFGGTLIPDVEEAGYRSHRSGASAPEFHPVAFQGSGLVLPAADSSPAKVNTFHHQAVDAIGAGLSVAARADDGIVEALERPGAEHFFLLVQWHPERMEDQSQRCSGGIAKAFLGDIVKYMNQQRTILTLGDDHVAA